jgi:hypothetical protein
MQPLESPLVNRRSQTIQARYEVAARLAKVLVLGLLMATSSGARALDLTSSGIYAATKEACLALPATSFERKNPLRDSVLMAAARDGFVLNAPRFREMIWAVRRQAVKSALGLQSGDTVNFASSIVESEEFKRALEECYPQNARLHRSFRAIVKRAEFMSGISAIAALLLTSQAPSALIKGLGWAANAAQWQFLSAKALSMLLKSAQVVENTINGFLFLSLLRSDTEPKPPQAREISVEEFKAAAQALLPKDARKIDQSLQVLIDDDLEELAAIEAQLAVERDEAKRTALRQAIDEIKRDLALLRAKLTRPTSP